ncbi:MAG: hybrid sensor histidine kinase/response regulator, partial [Rhodobacterales bacterium]
MVAYASQDMWFSLGLIATAAVLGSAIVLAWLGGHALNWFATRRVAAICELVARDTIPSVVTDADGEVLFCNPAADARFGPVQGQTLPMLFKEGLAHLGPVLWRLQEKAALSGSEREDIVTRGGHLRISVLHLDTGGFLWRAEDMSDRSLLQRAGIGVDLAMLTVGRSGAVLSMNDAARNLIGERIKSLDRLSTDLPLRQGQVHRISTSKG